MAKFELTHKAYLFLLSNLRNTLLSLSFQVLHMTNFYGITRNLIRRWKSR